MSGRFVPAIVSVLPLTEQPSESDATVHVVVAPPDTSISMSLPLYAPVAMVVVAVSASVTPTSNAGTAPVLAMAISYSISAPGIAFGSVVLLNGSLMTVALLVTASVADDT